MKKSLRALTDLDRAVLEICQRKVRSKDGREMSVIEGLLGQDAAAALQGDDQAIKRLRAEYARACDRNVDRIEADNEYASEWVLTHFEYFNEAQRPGLPPPEILPHPAHVRITEEGPVITGPITAEDRAWWESIKAAMRWAMETLAAARRLNRAFSDERSRHFLRKIRALVERIRRKIPPGWDWKEKIYTIGSSAEELAQYQEEVEQRLERENPEMILKIDEEVASWFPRTSLKKTSTARAARRSDRPHPA